MSVTNVSHRLRPVEGRLKLLKTSADLLIYASVALGVALLVQLYDLVPSWLFYSVLIGWILYFLVAIEAARGRQVAYPSALALSLLTLLVSFPQPEHYSLVNAGLTAASLTFIAGSAVQVAVIISTTSYLLMKRKKSRERSPSGLEALTS